MIYTFSCFANYGYSYDSYFVSAIMSKVSATYTFVITYQARLSEKVLIVILLIPIYYTSGSVLVLKVLIHE